MDGIRNKYLTYENYKEQNKRLTVELKSHLFLKLSEYFGTTQTDAHRAWCDAEANAYVYLKLKNR